MTNIEGGLASSINQIAQEPEQPDLPPVENIRAI